MTIRVDRTRIPELGKVPTVHFPRVRATDLSSGLALRTVEHPGLPVVQFLLFLPTGSSSDPADRPGLAALTADLLDEGSESKSVIELHGALDRIGARLGIHVGVDATTVSLTTLSRHTEDGLALLAEVVAQPRFDQADLERVRELRRSRIRQRRTVPGAVADQVFVETLYPGHPYGHLSIGTDESLSQLTVDDVRQFHQTAYSLRSATLIAAGALTHDPFHETAERVFNDMPVWGSRTERVANEVSPPSADVPAARVVLVDRPGAVQSELRIGHVAVARRAPDYHALLVLNMVLGGQFVSRLNRSLREEKGYTYGVRTAFDFRRLPGPFSLQGSVQADATGESIAEVLEQMEAINGKRAVTTPELDLARAALTRGFARGFETAGQVVRSVAHIVQHDLPEDDYDQFVPRVEGIGASAVTEAARTHLHADRAVAVVVGPADQLETQLETLGLGDMRRVEI